jgi:MFS family permease
VAALIGTAFLSVLAFANFESTLSLLLNDRRSFNYTFEGVLLVFAYVGFVLTVAQGVLVRRMAKRFGETPMATTGSAVTALGLLLVAWASRQASLGWLLAGVTVLLGGFSFVIPSLNSLISRRSDPAKQGGILGLLQSTGSLARVLGPVVGNVLFVRSQTLPFFVAAGLLVINTALILAAGRAGRDYGSPDPVEPGDA